jgi:MoaA/NifB/PqqE/SkfB family radical SAM enzyme
VDFFPEIVTFRLTARCTQNCLFCYGPKNIAELDFKTIKQIIAILARQKTKAITLTGGEPLLRQDIEKILVEIKHHGLIF